MEWLIKAVRISTHMLRQSADRFVQGTEITEKEPASSDNLRMTCPKKIPKYLVIVLLAWTPHNELENEPEVRDKSK